MNGSPTEGRGESQTLPQNLGYKALLVSQRRLHAFLQMLCCSQILLVISSVLISLL